MIMTYRLVFDEVMIKQIKKLGKDKLLRNILSRMLDRLEERGPEAGKLLDSQLHMYEIKRKDPPLRLYFKFNLLKNEIYVFEYEMKTSKKKQKKTAAKIK